MYFYDAAALTGTAQVAPAPVYWIDESFTTVTPNAADAYYTTTGACVARLLDAEHHGARNVSFGLGVVSAI